MYNFSFFYIIIKLNLYFKNKSLFFHKLINKKIIIKKKNKIKKNKNQNQKNKK